MTLNEKIDKIRKSGRSERAKEAHGKASRLCLHCSTPVKPPRRFCTEDCRSMWVDKMRNSNIYPPIGSLALGAASEYSVTADLLRRGYDVYTAASPGAVHDIVAMDKDTGELIPVQVRTGDIGSSGALIASARFKTTAKVLAVVTRDGVIQYTPDLPPLSSGSVLL